MTKSRKFISLEISLKQILKDLEEGKIKEATKKSNKWFYRCSDPDIPEDNIHHIDSIELDKKSLESGKGHPMLTAHQAILEKEIINLNSSERVSNTLIDIGVNLGKLMETTKDATKIKSEGGKEITIKEQQIIADSIKKVEEKITKLKVIITKNKKD